MYEQTVQTLISLIRVYTAIIDSVYYWLPMHIPGLLRNEKETLIPNDCHCGETNCTGYNPNVLVSTRK